MTPGWQYDELSGLATDFHDPAEVARYDSRQHTDVARERLLVKELGIGAGDTIVEFGPGTGAFAIAAAEACKQVIAVDVSQPMLDYASRQASGLGIGNIDFVKAGFLTYEHLTKPVDVVVTKFAFHHLPDFWKVIALTRINAILKPGGLLYVQDVVYNFAPEDAAEHLEGWINTMSGSGASFSREDFEGHIRAEHSTFHWLLEAMFTAAGFAIEFAVQDTPVYARYRCRKNR